MTTALAPAPDTVPMRPGSLEDVEDVATWLRALSPGAVCGRAHDPGFCPLARYLAAQTGADGDVSVGLRTYRVGPHDAELPRWARHFVSAVDAVPARRPQGLGPGITAAEALEALESVMALEQARQRRRPPLRGVLWVAQGSRGHEPC